MHALTTLALKYLTSRYREDTEGGLRQLLKANAEQVLTAYEKNVGFPAVISDKSLVPASPMLALLDRCFNRVDAFKDVIGTFETSGWLYPSRALAAGEGFQSVRDYAFFWSVIEAETIFLNDFLPFQSHEERITGTLISTLAMVARDYAALCSVSKPLSVGPAVSIFDTATDSNEKKTGADIGLIVRSGNHTNPLVKVARLQVKVSNREVYKKGLGKRMFRVANGTGDEGRIVACRYPQEHGNYKQLQSLLKKPDLGYYLVVNEKAEGEKASLPCLVAPASKIAQAVATRYRTQKIQGYSAVMDGEIAPMPLAAFLAIGLTVRDSGWGYEVSFTSGTEEAVAEAAEILYEGGKAPRHCLLIDTTVEPLNPRLVMQAIRNQEKRLAAEASCRPKADYDGDASGFDY